MDKPNLKPCPFCSGDAAYGKKSVFCLDCYAEMNAPVDIETLANLWNTRAQMLEDCANVQNLINERTLPTNVHKIKNERGAGRKPKKLAVNIVNAILYRRKKGDSIRKIAKVYGYSVGYVHKLIKEHKAG